MISRSCHLCWYRTSSLCTPPGCRYTLRTPTSFLICLDSHSCLYRSSKMPSLPCFHFSRYFCLCLKWWIPSSRWIQIDFCLSCQTFLWFFCLTWQALSPLRNRETNSSWFFRLHWHRWTWIWTPVRWWFGCRWSCERCKPWWLLETDSFSKIFSRLWDFSRSTVFPRYCSLIWSRDDSVLLWQRFSFRDQLQAFFKPSFLHFCWYSSIFIRGKGPLLLRYASIFLCHFYRQREELLLRGYREWYLLTRCRISDCISWAGLLVRCSRSE